MPLSINDLSVKALEADFVALVATRGENIFWANQATGRLFGYNSDELIGQPTHFLFPDESSYKAFSSNVQAAIALKSRYRGTVPQKLKNGQITHLQFSISQLGEHPEFQICAISELEESFRPTERSRVGEMHRLVVEDQTEVICRFLSDGTIVFVNQAFCRFFGKTSDQLLGHDWRPEAHPDDLEMIGRKLEELSPENPVVIIENRVFAAGGQLRWMQFVNRGVFDDTRQLKEIQSVGRDISDQKCAEMDLKQSEERYRALVEATSVLTWSCPPSGEHNVPQPLWMSFTGQSAEEMLGTGWTNAVHPDDIEHAATRWRSAVELGTPFANEHRIRRFDGEWRWIKVKAVPVLNPNGQITEWVGKGHDVTEHRKASLLLKQNREWLELAMAGSEVAFWNWDIQKHKISVDERLVKMLGYLPGELDGDEAQWLSLIDPRDRPKYDQAIEDYLRGDSVQYFSEHRLRHKEGYWITVEARGKAIWNDGYGAPLRMVGTLLNVTHRKQLKDECIDLLKKVEALIRRFETDSSDDTPENELLSRLTNRERQVLVMIAEGFTSTEIGRQLNLSSNTIISHRKKMMAKLGLHTAAEVTRFAMSTGLLKAQTKPT